MHLRHTVYGDVAPGNVYFFGHGKFSLAQNGIGVNHARCTGCHFRRGTGREHRFEQKRKPDKQRRRQNNPKQPQQQNVFDNRHIFLLADLYVAENFGVRQFGNRIHRQLPRTAGYRTDFFAPLADLPHNGKAARRVQRVHLVLFIIGNGEVFLFLVVYTVAGSRFCRKAFCFHRTNLQNCKGILNRKKYMQR